MTAILDAGPRVISNLQDALRAIEDAFDLESAKQPNYKANAATTFKLRYSRKGSQGEPTESPAESHWRVALNVASVTVLYAPGAEWQEGDEEPQEVTAIELDFPFRTIARQYNWNLRHGRKLKEFTALVANGFEAWMERAQLYYNELLADLIFVPNSPTWTGAGTPLGQLAACFVLPTADSLIAGESSIMKTLTDAVAIQKTGGGNGFSFGRIRPAKSRVSTSMGEATGPVGFLSMYDAVFDHIRQGGSRRGANMGVLPVWHPDTMQFIYAKTVEGEIENFNISVGITDKFMAAVEGGDDWSFTFPGPDGDVYPVEWNGEQVETVPARELYDLIVTNAHKLGDPGALFLDAANRQNPTPYWYELESTNPCGEQWLGPYENCCLGSIAVQHFVRNDGSFDWVAFQATVELATEFLDDVVDANAYVVSVPELEEAAQGGRRIGLGQMGVADALWLSGYRYGDKDGLDFASQVTEFLSYHTLRASVRRAEERGAFPRIEQSIYDPNLLREQGEGAQYGGEMRGGKPFTGVTWRRPEPKVAHELALGRPDCDWDSLFWSIVEYGVRNSCSRTFAPTGTIATVAGVEGYGCEPVFGLAYDRKVMQEGEDITLIYLSELFERALVQAGLDEDTIAVIKQKVKANGGSCQDVEEVPEEIRRVYVVASDVTPAEHVWMQAVLQAHVDNSISKTINLRKQATVTDVGDAYTLAWRLGCKGITIYRQGSRDREVLTATKAAETGSIEVVDLEHWPIIKPLPIPPEAETDGLPSRTYTVRTPFGKLRATITSLEDYPDRPFDVELGIGRGGSDVNAFTEAIGRLASLLFRAGVSPEEVADQLIGIGGTTQETTLRPDKARSLPDAFGKLLVRFSQPKDEAKDSSSEPPQVDLPKKGDPNELCPKCKQFTLAMIEGCSTCQDPGCGFSKCG